jgi:hypothetical protein
MNQPHHCLVCEKSISQGIYDFSTEVHGYPLCLKHQIILDESQATPEAITLYLALKSNKLPVELEYWDGKKTVDVAVPGRLYIEMEDIYDQYPEQAFTDLLKTVDCWDDEIPTFRVSTEHIQNIHQLELIVDRVSAMCSPSRKTA